MSVKSPKSAGPVDSMARMALGSSAEIPQILLALDQGTVLIRFFRKRKLPERRVFCLKTDTFEILQYPMGRGKLTLSEESSARLIEIMCTSTVVLSVFVHEQGGMPFHLCPLSCGRL